MMLFQPPPVINGRIRAVWDAMPAHQCPIWGAVLQGCSYASVTQSNGPFRIPTGRPAIVVFGDDLHSSEGTRAFHGPSVDRYLARCGGVAIVSCEALPKIYAAVAMQAIALRQDVALVETRTAHAAEWRARVERAAPLAALLLGQVCETNEVL